MELPSPPSPQSSLNVGHVPFGWPPHGLDLAAAAPGTTSSHEATKAGRDDEWGGRSGFSSRGPFFREKASLFQKPLRVRPRLVTWLL